MTLQYLSHIAISLTKEKLINRHITHNVSNRNTGVTFPSYGWENKIHRGGRHYGGDTIIGATKKCLYSADISLSASKFQRELRCLDLSILTM